MLAHQTGELRSEVREVAARVDAANQGAMRLVLQEQIEFYLRLSVPRVLEALSGQFGMSWSDIAQVVRVTVQSLRNWRQGQAPAPDHHMNLARLAATLSVLGAHDIAEPASWLELSILHGYRPRRLDLLVSGREGALFDLATGHIRPEQALEALAPDWRDSLASEYEVFNASDGHLSLRKRR